MVAASYLVITVRSKCYEQQEIFTGQKIFIRRTDDNLMACIDDDSMIGVKSVHVLKTKREVISSKFVLGVFNSKLLNWFFRFENFHMVGKPLAEVKLIYVERLPLLNNGNSSEIIRRVTDILSKKKENPSADTSTLEKEIDQLVYQLYELTPEEIAIIEESIK